MKIKKILFVLRFSIVTLIIAGCNQNKLKELITYQTTYTYKSDTCDSVTVLLEHTFFNRDSSIIKFINYKDGYYYTADYNKKNNTLSKKFYSSNSVFLYSNISQLNNDKLEIKTEFIDSLNNVTYSIKKYYKKNTDQLEKQQNIFSDGSIQEYLYEYDEYSNLLKLSNVNNQDTVLEEFHKITYNNSGRIINDTIYYPGTRKIVVNEYKNDLLFYTIEKFEKKSDTSINYIPITKAYWKKYYLYNDKRILSEIRNIKMALNSKSFNLDSKVEIKYFSNGLIRQKMFYNSEKQKIYSINMDYRF